LQLITDCAKGLVDFVSTMVDISAIKKGSSDFKLKLDTVDMAQLLDEVCSLLSSATDKYGQSVVKGTVRLICDYRASRLPKMESDGYRLTQVFRNIIGNALKFTDQGYVRVSSVVKDDNGQKTIVVSCQDTGKGIDKDAIERIFEPFEQEDSSDTRAHAGLGLGLAISREIVRKLGGDIHVVSTPGKGSCFSIILPLLDTKLGDRPGGEAPSVSQLSEYTSPDEQFGNCGSDLELDKGRSWVVRQRGGSQTVQKEVPKLTMAPALPEASSIGGAVDMIHESDFCTTSTPMTLSKPYSPAQVSARDTSERKLRVLSVDDELVNQEVVRGYFSELRHRFEVHAAMSGMEALEKLRTQVYDVVLLDLMMPQMSGFDVLVKIRSAPGISDIPVIVLSARGEHDVIADALWKGATDYFLKPIDFSAVLSRLDHVIVKRRGVQGAPMAMPCSQSSDVLSSDDNDGVRVPLDISQRSRSFLSHKSTQQWRNSRGR
jgi:two-component system sensor histidine kinase ChiS